MTFKSYTGFVIGLYFFLLGNFANAQIKPYESNSFIYLNWANDFFVQTDYYFSNGIDLGMVRKSKQSIFSKQIDFISFDQFSIVQDFFTPTNIDVSEILFDDRPYAAYLFGSYQKHLFSATQKLYFNPEISVGIIGQGAMGRQLQTFTHKLSPPSKPPQGWQNQVVNDLALNLNFGLEKGLIEKKQCLFNVFSEARLGTIYTDLSFGGRLRYGKFNSFFQSNKNLSFATSEKWQLFVELKPSLKFVAYNATLQGGVFNTTSPYILDASEISRWLGLVDFSITTSYKGFYFNGLFTWNSKEFKSAMPHQWVTLEFGWAF